MAVPIPNSPDAAAAKAKTGLEKPHPFSPDDISGTSAAKQDITMKKAEKTTKVAGQAEQDLPGDTSIVGDDSPTTAKSSANPSSQGNEKLDASGIDSMLVTKVVTSAESVTPTVTSTSISPTTNADTRALEQMHDIVALHAMRLRESGSDSLHIVVKPSAGIQLSLELKQNNGGIEVQASLHKGDFEHLSQHWPDLQQRMEARGVRVGTLTCSDNFSGTNQQSLQQSKQQSSHQDPLFAGAFAEFALAGSINEAPAIRAARATAYRGWETWA